MRTPCKSSVRAWICFAWILAVALPVLPLGGGPRQDNAAFSWRRDSVSAALLKDGRAVWQFNFSPDRNIVFFSPLALPGGEDLTWLSPRDHPYHFALFFCWKYLNGVNYWEETPEGITRWSNVEIDLRPDFSARITMDLRYRPGKSPLDILTEKRSIRTGPPAQDGSYFMDWRLDFTAGDDPVTLDRTPPDAAPDGNPRGGYSGLSIRLARDLVNPVIAAAGDIGAMANHRYGFTAPAADFSGEIRGGAAGIAVFDHPANPRHPTRWYGIADPSVPFWFLNASLLQPSPYTLEARQHLVLRYRVFVHPGRWDAGRLRDEQARFVREEDTAALPPR